MSEKRHPNIVLLMGVLIDQAASRFWIVTELLETDLKSLLAARRFTHVQRLRMCADVARGLRWLHAPTTVLHLDLKLENILVDRHDTLKVADFGFSAIKTDQKHYLVSPTGSKIGNLLHKAPELIASLPFNEKADVYSFGILAWEVN